MTATSTGIRCFPVRYGPGTEIVSSVHQMMEANQLKSVFIMSCVGSVRSAKLRMPATGEFKELTTPHEIVSLVGTFDEKIHHLHGSFSNSQGNVIGGHIQGESLIVFTTAELMLAECEDVTFSREYDPESGYDELVIHKKSSIGDK
ncbi:unnamed protein product [Didymodactylos carnosus]|uniref:PPC domain-containing protein n=1 Tax=Didymodactylos carnosus TaxID=1234261 RepID=A0A815K4B7_9BILA|nr:unnamed protein product [Didymodactylos carnosus]CAF1388368.1 unnamed protein product [Didymodactylos carnosus]CAF3777997.1 unnamed protein product [Didymodactylos carnosus]CAF4283117.1 unnamed protein product [Didymodactylos carnosus]